MTDGKEIAKVVAAGGKFLLDAYFAVYDEKERAHPGAPPVSPSFPEVLLAAGARLPGIEDAVANLMGHQTNAPPPASAVEARIQQADAAIGARMAALQARVMALETAIASLCRLLEPGAPSPVTPSSPAPSSPPPPPLPPDVVVLLDARERQHNNLLAEGEEAVATLEGAVELLSTRVVALVGGGPSAGA
jgi:hypothetical protein